MILTTRKFKEADTEHIVHVRWLLGYKYRHVIVNRGGEADFFLSSF